MRKYISIFVAAVMLCVPVFGINAGFDDVSSIEYYAQPLERLVDFGIISGHDDGDFKPEQPLTREQFSKLIISASGLDSLAGTLKGVSIFPDVEENRWSSGYINAALNEGYITGKPDGNFHPAEPVTFAEVCTTTVKALGYKETDISGLWPKSHIEKAKELELTENIKLNASDEVPRWAVVVIIDRLLKTNVKTSGAGQEITFAEETGLYEKCIVLGDGNTYDGIAKNQVITDKGIYYLAESEKSPEVGNEYGMVIEDDTITKIYNRFRKLNKISVQKVLENKITYKKLLKTGTMELSKKTDYYYKGNKINYGNLSDVLGVNSYMIFAYNQARTGYEYAVIIDPVYGKPEIVENFNLEFRNVPIIRNGEIIDVSDIQKKDMVYRVTDITGLNPYIYVTDNKAEGKLDAILPNRLSPKTIEIDGKSYKFSPNMNFDKISTASSQIKTEDHVIALLGYDGKVVDIYKPEYTGEEIEIIITGSPAVSDKLNDKQILTDKGMFYISDNMELELGNKYEVVTDEDRIIKVCEKLKSPHYITVDNIVGTKISYMDTGIKSMVLSENTVYYHNGKKAGSYDNLKNIIEVNTGIIFAKNEDETGYEYALILDPVYGSPEIAVDYNHIIRKVGEIELAGVKIIKNGEIIEPDDIEENDVIYEVSDFWNENKYILVIDKRVKGIITGILPNKLSPEKLQLDGKNYDFSPDMDFDRIRNTTNTFKIEDEVIALLGCDEKVVDIIYPVEEEVADYAMVVNYQETISTDIEDYGTTIYYVKLLLANGKTVTYKAENDPANKKGSLVRFTKRDIDPDEEVEDIIVTLDPVHRITKWSEYEIDKDEMKIDDNYVTENVAIFNRIHNVGQRDVRVDLLDWDELFNGTIGEGKIQFMNKIGDFEDINIIFIDDLFDEKYKYGVVTDIRPGHMFCTITMLIEGTQHVYNSKTYVAGEIGSVLKVKYIEGNITEVIESAIPVVESETVQAIDNKRIKINDVIYPFKDNITIYLKDNTEKITLKGVDYIDTDNTYGKVSVYLDKPLEKKGKVETLVIYE